MKALVSHLKNLQAIYDRLPWIVANWEHFSPRTQVRLASMLQRLSPKKVRSHPGLQDKGAPKRCAADHGY